MVRGKGNNSANSNGTALGFEATHIGKAVDDAMVAIERDNKSLRGVLPKDYARPALDTQCIGDLIDLISGIEMIDKKDRSKDVLGDVISISLPSLRLPKEGKQSAEGYQELHSQDSGAHRHTLGCRLRRGHTQEQIRKACAPPY